MDNHNQLIAHPPPLGWTGSEAAYDYSHPLPDHSAYHKHWKEFHCKVDANQAWFLDWLSRVPANCDCGEGLASLVERLPPRFGDWFAYSVEFHNAINLKLNKPMISIEDALRAWRPIPRKHFRFTGCKLVTSFGPKRIERQLHCLETWLRCGVEVVAMQCASEIDSMRSIFKRDGVSFTVAESTTGYEFATPKLDGLLRAVSDSAFLLLNSDLAIADFSAIELATTSKQRTAFLRWNHDDTHAHAIEFEWGLDAFLLWPEDVHDWPESPFGIGQPCWDYALPYWLASEGRSVVIDHSVCLTHENHEQAWSQAAWHRGNQWMQSRWEGVDTGVPAFRQSLDPQFKFDLSAGRWLRREAGS